MQMLFVVSILLIISYFAADFIVSQERDRISFQSSEISNLVGEARLKNVDHILVVAAEKEHLPKALNKQDKVYISSLLTNVFNTQIEGDLDFLLVANPQAKIIWNIGGGLHNMSVAFPQIESRLQTSRLQFIEFFYEPTNPRPLVYAYQVKEVLDPNFGQLVGYLVGGIYLTDNFNLISEIRKRGGADKVELLWHNKIIATSQVQDSQAAVTMVDSERVESAFVSEFLESIFPGSPLEAVLYFPEDQGFSLASAFSLSAAVAIAIVLILTALTLIFARRVLQKPLGELVSYATQVKQRSSNAIAPSSGIQEFSELSDSLDDVFRAFKDSETRLQDFASVTSDSIWETDPDGKFTFLSRKAGSAKNLLPTEMIIGHAVWDVKYVDQDYSDWQILKDKYKNQKPFKDFQYRRVDGDGIIIYWSASGKPIFDSEGNFLGFRGTTTNITPEVESRILAEESDHRLRQSQKMEVVGQLTGGIAHDFNNILGIILGNLEILESMLPDNKAALDRIKKAQNGTMRGAGITRKLLGFARKEDGHTDVTKINPFVYGLKDLIEKSVTASIQVKTYLNENLWNVAIDPGDLEDAILNLCLNAKDAMPDGGLLVIETSNKTLDEDYVWRNPESTTGDYVMISVSDNGSGIQEDIQNKILEPFFTTKQVGQGTGLGLSMVYGFVKRSGGHLKIYSELGEGTSFKLFLPKSELQESEIDNCSPLTPSIMTGSGKILVVEDEASLREVAVTHLEKLGYQTLSAEDAQQAQKILNEHDDIDLLFTDIVMPGKMNGYQLAETAHKKYPNLKIVLTSGFTKKMNEITNGEDNFLSVIHKQLLSKPYNISELSQSIHKTMNPTQ